MARPCTVCTHPELAKIDEALVAGQAHRPIATAYGVGRWAVLRHRRNHLSPALREAYAKREAAREETLVDRLEQLYDRVEGILDAAESEGHAAIGLLAAREVRQCLELLGRFLGQLDGNALTVNGPVTWQVLNYAGGPGPDAILRALEPWPEAQAAVRGLLVPPPVPTSAPVLDRPPLVPAPRALSAPVVPTSALETTAARMPPPPSLPPPAVTPPRMEAADRELLREADARRRADELTQQVAEPRR